MDNPSEQLERSFVAASHGSARTDASAHHLRVASIKIAFGTTMVAAIRSFSRDKATDMAAALAFYAILSAGPLLVVILAVADTFWGREAATHQLLSQLQGQLGAETVQALDRAVANSRIPGEIGFAAAISGIFLLSSSTLLFAQLRDSLRIIWRLPSPDGAARQFLKQRFFAFAAIVSVALLLLVSTVVSSVVSMLRDWLAGSLPLVVRVGFDWLVSWTWFTLLIAVLFRVLSGRGFAWRNIVVGSVVSASLFLVGKELIALYLAKATVASAYGAAGAVATLALWVYYSSMALFFGAEYARAWGEQRQSALA